MKRAIVHVGMPRTGSTTFQYVLNRLRPDLNAVGILYPELTPASAQHHPHINHQHLGETLDGRRPRQERQELLEDLSRRLADGRCDTVLLSYESFVQLNSRRHTPAILGTLFARHGFAMEALLIVKPQSEYLNSMYTHRVQFMRERHDFRHFARAYGCSGWFAYDRLIRGWTASCAGRVRAVALRDRRSPAPLVLRLLSEVGLEDRIGPLLRPEDLQRVENRSPGPVAVEVSRRLRAMRMHRRSAIESREITRYVEQAASDRGLDRTGFRGVDADTGTRMDARYRAANDRFARDLWKHSWAEVVASEPASEVNELALRRIDPATELALGAILQQTCARFGMDAANPLIVRPANLMDDGVELLRRWLRLL